MNDRPFYCAACAHHGTNKHDPGCPNDDSPMEALRVENRRLRALLTEARMFVEFLSTSDYSASAVQLLPQIDAALDIAGVS